MYTKEVKANAYNQGYLCFYDKEHPLATEACQYRVFLHRHVASLNYGRWLTTEEQVHHIDGNKLNNDPSNLEVLTASEHMKKHHGELPELVCNCGVKFRASHKGAKYCSYTCSRKSSIKYNTLTKEVLNELIPTTSWVQLGKLFGYSDVGIKKRAIALGCNIPVRNKRSG